MFLILKKDYKQIKKSLCLHREMSEKNRTQWFTIKRWQNTDIND